MIKFMRICLILFILSIQLLVCNCQIDVSGEDKTHLVIEYEIGKDIIPYNITLYKDPSYKYIQTILQYNCENLNKTIKRCSTQTTLEDSKNIWGSLIRSCVNRYDSFKNQYNDECGYESEPMYKSLYKPYKLQFLNSPPTRGGLLNITGYFLRVGNLDVSKMWLMFDPFKGWKSIEVKVLGDYMDPSYNPNSLSVQYVRGYGIQVLCLDRLENYCYNISYIPPTITNTYYNHSNQQITIYGNNFYNESKVINITVGSASILKSDMVLVDFEKIIVNYPTNQSQQLNIQLAVDVLQTFGNVTIEPVPLSSTCNVTKYNDGIVEITGTHLSSSSPSGSIKINVTINNNNCIVVFNNETLIQCKLSKVRADNNKHLVQVCQNGICNVNQLYFEYGKPIINQFVQSDKIFTLYGQNHGNLTDKSTHLSLKYNNINVNILPKSISASENESSFEIPFFCGNATAQLIVNGITSNIFTIAPVPLIEISQLPSTDAKDPLYILISYYDCKYYSGNSNPKFKSSQVQGNRVNNNTYYTFNVGRGTGHKSDILLFADQEIEIKYSYAKPIISNHSINITLDSQNVVTINGNNFGTNSSLCKVLYQGSVEKCQVHNDYKITFKVDQMEISANIFVIIDGIQSESYTLELVNCDLLENIKYPTTFGCLSSPPAIHYICKGLTSFKSKLNPQLLHATYNDKETKIIIKEDNVTIPIPEGSNSSILKLYLNGLFSESYQINRESGLVNKSTLKFNEKDNSINLNIHGLNFGEPYHIQLPTLLNSSIDTSNCSLLYHGTPDNKLCTADIINCQISLPLDFNKTIFINNNSNSTLTSIPYILVTGGTTIKSNITSIEHTPSQEKNHTKIALAIALPIGLVALIVAGVFGGYKYHKNKIDSSKKKNIQ